MKPAQGIKGVTLDDIYLGNGAGADRDGHQRLLDNGDELLLPRPTTRCGRPPPACPAAPRALCATRPMAGCPTGRHPRRITPAPRASSSSTPTTPPVRCTRGLLLQIVARPRAWLVIFADEVYDKVLYDGAKHTPLASLSIDVLTLTFNSLSKATAPAATALAGW
jgi:alanine-synthesizing transaminase